jgi:hypothetical protein
MSKSETNPKPKSSRNAELKVLVIGISALGFVSDFVLEISNLLELSLGGLYANVD